ncbi:MAG: PilZ domain-containing protein [Candidatus Omnitrophica bacterium]|nr:PilZ domain-containing protein [Candidatus Omnitrophota bacterium]
MGWESEERREFVRVKYPCKITVIGQNGQTISAQTENISAGGIRILSKNRLIPNSHIELQIHLKDSKTISCKGRVVWMFERTDIPGPDSVIYDTGIEFKGINEQDLKMLKKLIVDIATGKTA